MEFNSIVGGQHTIEPIGYNQVRKKLRTDVQTVVRSIREQFLIHSLASDFQSPHIIIPTPIRIESPKSYVMDMVYHFMPLDYCKFIDFPELFDELIRFKNYMYVRGYFAAGFTILHHPERPHIYVCVDFSQFGTIDSNFVMFPKIPHKYTILEAETSFGLLGREIVTQSFINKHVLATSPRITPIHLSVHDFPELTLDMLDEHDDDDVPDPSISIQRTVSFIDGTESMFEIKVAWDKIDSLITHVHS
jgi:hypothetical protein